jgi:hypothetical protein
MTDPKAALTELSTVLVASEFVGREEFRLAEQRFGSSVVTLAESGAVARVASSVDLLRAEYSVTSVEEVVALQRVEERRDVRFLERAGLNPKDVAYLAAEFAKSERGQLEVADWDRYTRFEYPTGCEIDLDNPPEEEPQAFALGTPGSRAVPMGAGFDMAAPPAGTPTVSLIDQWMEPIRDQADRGTCTAFSGIACLEYHQHRFGGHHNTDLSEQFAYWNMVEKTGDHNLVAMFDCLLLDGSCRERIWPYYGTEIPDNDSQDPPPPDAVDLAQAYRPRVVRQLPPRSVDIVKQTLAASIVVAIGIPVYASWYESDVVRKYGNITVPFGGEVAERVGHAVALVGYEDNAQYAGGGYFIVRNSWGDNWGTHSVFGPGYGTIPYRYIEKFNWDARYIAS